MNADILLRNVEFFGAGSGQRIRVNLREEVNVFSVQLNDYLENQPPQWATTNDPALDVEAVNTNVVKVTPRKVGTSEIQVQVNRDVRFYLTVEVFDPQEATDLGLAAGIPEKK